MASQLFLASLLGVMVIFFLLYGIDEDTVIDRIWHALILTQFLLVGFMEIAAFLLLSTAILVAGNLVTGVWGMVLITVMIVGTIVVGTTVKWRPWPGEYHVPSPEITNVITRIRIAAVVVLFILELGGFGLLLGFGSQAASDANPQWGCVRNDSFAVSTRYLYAPNRVLKVVSSSLSGSMRRLLNAEIMSNLVKNLGPCSCAMVSSISGSGYLSFLVMAFSFR